MSTSRERDTTAKVSRIKDYLQKKHPPGFTVESGVSTQGGHLLFRVKDPEGKRKGLLAVADEFINDYWDVLERELDAADVIGVMAREGERKIVVVDKSERRVEDLTEEPKT